MAKTKTSHLDRLQATLTSLQNEFDKEKERVHHKKRHDRLQEPMKTGMIPKPRGHPGRAGPDSYNVMNAMKLSKAQYNFVAHCIHTLVAWYLDVTCTLSQQPDKMLVEKVIARARSQNPILKQYEGGWAIRDIMAQYLHNWAAKECQLTWDANIVFPAKKCKEIDGGDSEEEEEAELALKFQPTKRAQRSKSESELSEESGGWDEEDSDLDDFDSGDSKHESESENKTILSKLGASKSNKANKGNSGKLIVSKQSKSSGKVKANKGSSNEESDEPPIVSKQSKSGSKAKVNKSSSNEIIACGTVLMKVSNPGEELKGRREEVMSNEVIKIRVPKLKLPKSSNGVDGIKDTTAKEFWSSEENKEFEAESTVLKRNAVDFSYTLDSDSDAGVLSPNGDWLQRCPECKEDMPLTILPYLASLIKRYCNLRHRSGRFTIPVSRMAMDICNLVHKEKLKDLALEMAAKQKWPISEINFRLILKRMHALSGELNQLIFNRVYLEKSFIWNMFKESLTADGLSIKTFSSLRAGEINPASNVALRAETGYYGMKGNTIIMHMLFSIYPQTRTPTAAFHPLSYSYFLFYMLIPYIAIELITKDLKCNLEDAYQQMIKSSPVGFILFWDTDGDEELDLIYCDNIIKYQRQKANDTSITQRHCQRLIRSKQPLYYILQPTTNDPMQRLSSELQPQPQPRPLLRRFD
ncbi:hypothetical protein J3R82DRAFT_11223 [Butyriboletus roseoflavus]|nr:hypothetical protein J3R82DRAFT_11223 [Butyriboletus roseoflavus]